MYEYQDIMAQLKYPGVSRCMSRIYMAVNTDDVRYTQESRTPQHRSFERQSHISYNSGNS